MTTPPLHTPYDGSSKPFTIGLKPLDINLWLDIDEEFDRYISEKKRLYTEETANVLVAEPGTEAAQEEVLELVAEYISAKNRHPGEGRDLSEPYVVKDSGLRRNDGILHGPLAQAGLLIQEDLVLMRHSADGWRLVAASLCFPSAWNLNEKFGRPMSAIHDPVPGFGPGTRNAGLIDRMFDNLRVEQPVIRWNWSLYGDDRLYHPASDNRMKNRFGDGPITGKVIMRLERQTLRKLPKSGDILFTIRIYNNPLEVLENHPDGRALARSIATQVAAFSDAEVEYKGLVGERDRLLQRLETLASNLAA